MAELTSMMNIGKEMSRKLTAIGVDTPERLTELGAEQVFLQLKSAIPRSAWSTSMFWKGTLPGPFITLCRKSGKEN